MSRKIRAFFKAFSILPYKWAWITMMICSVILFGWWDEVIVWGLGATYAWWVVPLYYMIEYGVVLPLAVFLGMKTYKKLGLKLSLRDLAVNSIKNSLPVIIYHKIKKRRR